MTCKQLTCFILAAFVSCAILTLFITLLFNGPLDQLFSYRNTKQVAHVYPCDAQKCEHLRIQIKKFKLHWNALDAQEATEHCAAYQKCLQELECFKESGTILKLEGDCEKYKLALDVFGPCREQLREKAGASEPSCLKFLENEEAAMNIDHSDTSVINPSTVYLINAGISHKSITNTRSIENLFLVQAAQICRNPQANRKCLRKEINATCGTAAFQIIKPLLPVHFDC